ncbi:MAG: hypothetical protein IJA02_05800 [Clostridia bacterium]|nr:hypothetical protein [Clostridia bacterium]
MYAVYTNTVNFFLLYLPDSTGCTALKLQKLFDGWLYDKNIDHDCWIYKNGRKYGVSYDVHDFIKWLNKNIFTDSDEKARISIDDDYWEHCKGFRYGDKVRDFIKWLNECVFTDREDKVKIAGESFPNTPVKLEILYY